MFMFIPIVNHNDSSIPNSACMAEAEVLSDVDILPVYLLHTINHIYQYFQNSHKMQQDKAIIRLLFTRHGETEENTKGIICGQQPGALTKVGKQQAKKIGIWLNKEQSRFDHIYVSDLQRTVDTFTNLKSMAKHLEKIPTTLTPILRQKCGGILQGKPLATWKQEADKQKKTIRQYKCVKGESWVDVNTRCFKFLQLLVENHVINNKAEKVQEQTKIFAVAHGGYLMQFHNLVRMLMFKQEGVFKNSAKNCSFHEFLIEYPRGEREYKLQNVVIKCTKENIVQHLK